MSKPNFQMPTSKNRIQPPRPRLCGENLFNLSESSLDLGKFMEVDNGPCSDLPKKDLKVQIGATHLGLSIDHQHQQQQGTFKSCEKNQKQVELLSRSSYDSHVEFVETKCLTDLPKELLNCIRQRTDEVGVAWSKFLDDLEFTTTNTTFSGIKNSASDTPRKMSIATVASQPKRKWTISNPSNGSIYEEEMMPMNIGKIRRIDEEHCEISKKIKTGVPKDQRSLSKISTVVKPSDTPPEESDYTSLPIMSPKEFEDLEKILVTKKQFSPWLLKRLKLVDDGGKNCDQQVKQILSTLFSKKMRQQINWTGRNGKVGFKNTKIQAIVYDAVRSNFPKVTDSELKRSIINFFRGQQQQPNKRGTGEAVNSEEKSFSENSELPKKIQVEKKIQKSPPTSSNKTKMSAYNNPSKLPEVEVEVEKIEENKLMEYESGSIKVEKNLNESTMAIWRTEEEGAVGGNFFKFANLFELNPEREISNCKKFGQSQSIQWSQRGGTVQPENFLLDTVHYPIWTFFVDNDCWPRISVTSPRAGPYHRKIVEKIKNYELPNFHSNFIKLKSHENYDDDFKQISKITKMTKNLHYDYYQQYAPFLENVLKKWFKSPFILPHPEITLINKMEPPFCPDLTSLLVVSPNVRFRADELRDEDKIFKKLYQFLTSLNPEKQMGHHIFWSFYKQFLTQFYDDENLIDFNY